MDILDRLRPRWRRSDPEVRAAAVREMGFRDQARLETLARTDPDARVRRIAIKKLEDPERLDEVARGETDEDLRAFASERARQVRVAAASADGPVADHRTAAKSVRQRARTLLTTAGDRLAIGRKEGRARQLELCLAVEKLTGTRDRLAAAAQVRTVQQEWAGIMRDVEPREDVAHR